MATGPTPSLNSVERPLEFQTRFSSRQPYLKSVYSPHNNCEGGRYYYSPVGGGNRGQSGYRFCLKPELKQKMKTQGSQPVTSHRDAMKRCHQEFPPHCLPLGGQAPWQRIYHCIRNTKPLSFPLGSCQYEVTQVPGQVLLNLQLMWGGEWAELAGQIPNNLNSELMVSCGHIFFQIQFHGSN